MTILKIKNDILHSCDLEEIACMLYQIMIEYGEKLTVLKVVPGEITFTTVEVYKR